MATYWTTSPYTFTADAPLHAGITIDTLQGNLTCVLENSGYHYEIRPFDALFNTVTLDITWTWLTDFKPIPIPVYPSMDGTPCRSYEISMYIEDAARDETVRVYILPGMSSPVIDAATGDITGHGANAYIDLAIGVAGGWYSDTIKDIIPGTHTADGIWHGVGWIHLAGKTTVAADDIKIFSIEIAEEA